MKSHLIRLPLSVLTAAAAALLATSITPNARADSRSDDRSSRAPLTGAIDLKTGLTSVVLDPTFQANHSAAGVQVNRVRPAHFVKGRMLFRFPISGGVVDLSTLEAEVIHSGGLNLRTATGAVALLDFIISLPSASPPTDPGGGLSDASAPPPPVAAGPAAELSALVIVNGSLVGRVPLFALDLTASGLKAPLVPAKQQRVSIEKVALALTADGAAALNAAFGVTSFTAGAPAGTANVVGLLACGRD